MQNKRSGAESKQNQIEEHYYIVLEQMLQSSYWANPLRRVRVQVLGRITNLTESEANLIARQMRCLARERGAYDVRCINAHEMGVDSKAYAELAQEAEAAEALNAKHANLVDMPWPWQLTRDTYRMMAILSRSNNRKKAKRPGRVPAISPAEGRRIYQAWSTKVYKKYADLAQARGKNESADEIRKALDAHRHALKREIID